MNYELLDQLWLLICSGLVFLMQAGFMCLESGLTRSKNSINVAVKNMADFAVSVVLFWAIGYGLMFGGSATGWFGSDNFLLSVANQPSTAVFFLFQAMFCGTATTIISGAVAERLKFGSYLIAVILVSGLIYPLFGSWAWNDNGWLRQMGFVDFAGSTVVHGVGAWVSLATLIIIGSRQGRFTPAQVNKIQGSNLPFAVLGALLLWVGWIGFNGGSALELNEQVPGIIFNTILSGAGGMIGSMLLTQWQLKRVEVEELINGAIAGLVAITACCHLVPEFLALIVGITSAAVAKLASQTLKRWQIDDAVDAVAVHGGAGIWGTLCVALFGQLDVIEGSLNRVSQLSVQLLGISVALCWAFGLTWLLLKPLNQFFPLRVSPQAEELGLNLAEHQAKTDAYELFQVMDLQAKTQDLTLRVPVEPFTEVGHIATRYNQVMDALERNHRENVESLEELYAITATAVSAIENHNFSPQEFAGFSDRPDELGILARTLQQMLEIINRQQQELNRANARQKQLIKAIISQILRTRFGAISAPILELVDAIANIADLEQAVQNILTVDDLETIKTLLEFSHQR